MFIVKVKGNIDTLNISIVLDDYPSPVTMTLTGSVARR